MFHTALRKRLSPAASAWIEHGFGGYRHRFNQVDEALPVRLSGRRRIGIIGGGVAGLSAAALLAERGYEVVLYEKNPYLGGKLAGWRERLADGFDASIEHGFHAFFRHYYNFNDFLDRVGACTRRSSVGSYTLLTREGRRLDFGADDGGPVLNLVSLARRGVYRPADVVFNPGALQLLELLRYDPGDTFARLDDVPFSQFAADARLPRTLQTVFTAFSRVFFADPHELSTAELIKSFHFFYLAQDSGLVFDVVEGAYQEAFTAPVARFLRGHGVDIRVSTPVHSLERTGAHFTVDEDRFDAIIVATDVRATQQLLRRSSLVRSEDPQLHDKLGRMHAGRRYCVWRLWLHDRGPASLPTFVSLERVQLLDALAWVHRTDPECAAWAKETGGSVVELHAYTIADAYRTDAAVRAALLSDLEHHLPSLRGARIAHEHLQVRDDFTALHTGMARHRPGVYTAIHGLLLAGDWVSLPFPAMLMEAAHTSARCAANALLRSERLREYPVDTIPRQGLLHNALERLPLGRQWKDWATWRRSASVG